MKKKIKLTFAIFALIVLLLSASSCKHKITDIFKIFHTESDWIVEVAPTCTTKGRSYKNCVRCGKILASIETDALGHQMIPGTNRCLLCAGVCGETFDHDWKDGKCNICKFTCGKDVKHTFEKGVCKVCEYICRHEEKKWIVDREATCKISGSEHSVCSLCGEYISENSIPRNSNHTNLRVEKTYKDDNIWYIQYKCLDCNDSIKEPAAEQIVLSEKVTEIADYAFRDYINLKYVYISQSVKSIGKNPFVNCRNLIEIIVDKNNEHYDSRENCNAIIETATNKFIASCDNTVIPSSVTCIGEAAFEEALNEKFDIPTGIKIISEEAFKNCKNLISIKMPSTITSIGKTSFIGCNKLTNLEIDQNNTTYSSGNKNNVLVKNDTKTLLMLLSGEEIPNEVKIIDKNAFDYHNTMKNIVIPITIVKIEKDAFINCSNLENLHYNGTIEDWCKISFSNEYSTPMYYASHIYMLDENNEYEEVTEVVIPETITKIGDYQFYRFSKVTSIEIPNCVTSIGSDAFLGCSSLTSITLPFVGNGSDKSHLGYIFGASSYSNNNKYVPSSLKEVTITGGTTIGDYAFYECSSLTNITIPNSVTSIGDSVFKDCNNLTKITLPFVGNGSDQTHFGYIFGASSYSYNSSYVPTSLKEAIITGVTSIEGYAFSNCSSLTNIEIPNSVKYIGNSAFSGCSSLTSIEFPNSVTSIGFSAFKDCTSLKSITLPFVGNGSDKAHFGYIFGASNSSYNNTYVPASLKEVIITGGTSIGYEAFEDCSSLTSIEIPNSVTIIRWGAFSGCSNLTSIVIPNSVTSIGYDAFEYCSSLENVYYKGTIEDWCKISFNNSDSNPMKYASHIYMLDENNEYEEVTEIVIPETINEIGYCQFYGFKNVTNVLIPNSVTSIGYYAFEYCSSLENVYYKGTIEDWCKISFNNSDSNPMSYASHIYMLDENNEYEEVTEIVIPETINEIGYCQFYGFKNVTNVLIPNSVTSIGKSAFRNCSSLTSIEIPNSVTIIRWGAFSGCSNLTSIVIPNSVTSIGYDAFEYCSSLENVYYKGTIEDWCKISFNNSDSNPMKYASHIYMLDENNEYEEVTEIVIPETINEIGYCQFYGFKNVTNVLIPNSVTSIGWSAFYNCSSLTSITIPNSVTSIRYYAFEYCSSLENVYYKGTIEDWCKISFNNSDSNPMSYASHIYMLDENNEYEEVTEIVIPEIITEIGNYQFCGFKNVTSITIPNSVTSIGWSAFYNCSSLTSITIPNSVTSIGERAFLGCSSLTSIEIPNSVTSIEYYAFEGCSNLTVYCEANSKPDGWHSNWNSSNCPVVWGYKK